MCAPGMHLMCSSHMCSTSKDLTKLIDSNTPKDHTVLILGPLSKLLLCTELRPSVCVSCWCRHHLNGSKREINHYPF